jgi:hypothetical protein
MGIDGVRISPEARLFAAEELCRRAGLGEHDLIHRCHLHQSPEGHVSLQNVCAPGSPRIDFPAATGALRSDLVVRKSWPKDTPAAIHDTVPDFIVPYCRNDSVPGQPLFLQTAPGEFRCTEDILASTALVLSRFEEIDATGRDSHARFPSAQSIAFRDHYLDRPIVDEYGLALQQVLQALDPGLPAPVRCLRVKLSHDIDEIGIPFSLRDLAVQLFARRRTSTALRDLLSSIGGSTPGSLDQVIEICRLAGERGLRPALYWKASPPSPFDSGYDIADPRISRVMDWAFCRNIEMGVHPGYQTFLSPTELRNEVERCRKALGTECIGGRQHYLRWSPETWAHWEQCGLAYDSSVGYADRAGFRAGTCWPYFPWLWKQNRRAALLEIPLILMDRTLVSRQYMGKTPEEALATARDLMRKCEAVGGVITLLWHNNCLGHPFSAYYPAIFDALSGVANYDWESSRPGQAAP